MPPEPTGTARPGFAAQLSEDLPPAAIRRVLQVFADDVARLRQMLQAASEAGDAAACRRAAHSLAGAAGAVGALELDQACRAASSHAESGPVQLAASVAEIDALCGAALAELAAFVAGLDGARTRR